MFHKFLNYIKSSPIDQRVMMFAMITKGGRLLAVGHNRKDRLAFPFKKINKYSELCGIHAEGDSIRKCFRSQLKGAIITVIGFNRKSNNQVLSRPCSACMNAIKEVGIKKIIYFDKIGKKYTEKVK